MGVIAFRGPLAASLAAVTAATGCGGDEGARSPDRPDRATARLVFVSAASVTSPSTRAIEVGGTPGAIVAADEGVWVAVTGGGGGDRVVRIDPATNRVAATVPIQGHPDELAVGDGAVWVTGRRDDGADVLQRIDPETNSAVATISFPGSYAGPVAAGEGAVWLVLIDREARSGSLARIEPETNKVALTIPLDAGRVRYAFDELAVSQSAVWVLALEGLDGPGNVIRVDPETNRVAATIRAQALNMGVGPGGLWITGCVDCDDDRNTFFAQEIDTDANAPVGPRIAVEDVGFGPLVVGDYSLWFSGYSRGEDTTAFKLDPETHAIEEYLRVGDFLFSGMAFDAENAAIWIARAAPPSVVRVDLDAETR